MLSEPDFLDKLKLIQLLREEYNLTDPQLVFNPMGECSWGYFVTTQNNKYYLKIYHDKNISTSIFLATQELYEKVHIDQISHPIKTKQNVVLSKIQEHPVVLLNYIQGNTGEEIYNAHSFQLGILVAKVHAATPHVITSLEQEDFQNTFAEDVTHFLDSVEKNQHISQSAANKVLSFKEQIVKGVGRFQNLSHNARLNNAPLVISHGDITSPNVILGSEKSIYLIDWDDLSLAPKEKDFMFFMDKKCHEFFSGYKTVIPEITLSNDIIQYYQLKWILGEIKFFTERILYDKNTETQTEYDKQQLDRALAELVSFLRVSE